MTNKQIPTRLFSGATRTAVFLLTAAILAPSAAGQDNQRTSREKETVSLTTKDGVQLKATYYPSKAGKEAAAIVLLHDYKGSRHQLDVYAEYLRDGLNAAVIAPDLRGHGDSTQQQLPGGRVLELDADRFRRGDFANMVRFDLEAVRKFLLEKNNESKLNLNKLAVVGAGMGATVGLLWTYQDWSMPPLATGKQGQDVKAVAVISPEWSYKGLPVAPAMNHPLVRSQVSLLVAYGDQSSSAERDAERIHKIAERGHPPFDPSLGKEKQEVFLVSRGTSRQGGELFPADVALGEAVRDFLLNRVVKQSFPWMKRGTD